MKLGRLFFCILAILLTLSFAACSAPHEEHVGFYSCARLELDGEDFYVLDVYPDGCALRLSKWGQAWLDMEGKSFYGRWELEGDNFTLDINGELSQGTLKNGVCVLTLASNGMEHSFLKEGASLPEKATSVQQTQLTDQQVFWNGDWYGFWSISNAEGMWQDHSSQRFDCFARIDIDEENSGSLVFWDELQDCYNPIAVADISIVQEDTESVMGVAVTTGGSFLDSVLEEGQWRTAPAEYEHDSFFYIEKAHYEGENGGFDYSILLRPWGRTWEDVEATAPDMLPYFYHDWYIPNLTAGNPMPDSFEYTQETIIRNTWPENEQETTY